VRITLDCRFHTPFVRLFGKLYVSAMVLNTVPRARGADQHVVAGMRRSATLRGLAERKAVDKCARYKKRRRRLRPVRGVGTHPR
jgi:hypothetical protein